MATRVDIVKLFFIDQLIFDFTAGKAVENVGLSFWNAKQSAHEERGSRYLHQPGSFYFIFHSLHNNNMMSSQHMVGAKIPMENWVISCWITFNSYPFMVQSSQMYLPLIFVAGGRSAAKIEDLAPSSIDSCLLEVVPQLIFSYAMAYQLLHCTLWLFMSVLTYPG